MSKNSTILIVDDEIDLAQSLARLLSEELYDTKLAHDGEEALVYLQDNRFDIVLLDLNLPKISGYEVLKHIKANIPATKVIVLTGYADLGNVVAVKNLGADDVIEKPYELGEVFDAINFVMKK